jgi:hypothetical protein
MVNIKNNVKTVEDMDPKIYSFILLSPVLALGALILLFILTRPVRIFLHNRRIYRKGGAHAPSGPNDIISGIWITVA